MAYERKDGDILISKNKYKQEGDKKPDLTGTALVAGVEMEISLWKKARNDGTGNFYSGVIKPKAERGGYQSAPAPAPAPAQGRPAPKPPQAQDDIPF